MALTCQDSEQPFFLSYICSALKGGGQGEEGDGISPGVNSKKTITTLSAKNLKNTLT